jgi:hypothetical protein
MALATMMEVAMRPAFFSLLALVPCIVFAQSPVHYIVDINQEKIFVDVGKKEGAQPGMKFRVFQSIKKTHPVTGALLQDKIEVGVVTLLEVGDSLSIGRLEKTGETMPSVGAVIEKIEQPTQITAPVENKPPTQKANPNKTTGQHFPLSFVDAFEPVEVDVTFGAPVSRVLLFYRRTGEGKNTMLAMETSTSGRYVAEIPPEIVDAPSIEYQISFLDEDGNEKSLPPNGAAYRVEVKPRGFSETLDLKELRGKSSELSLSMQSVAFGGSRGGYLGSTVDYHHRIFNRVYGIRMGGGFLRGQAQESDGTLSENNYVFGLAEVEFRMRRYLSLLPQVTLGVEQTGFSTGGQLQLRIGREVGYNLLLGASGVVGLGGGLVSVNLNAPAGKALTLGGEIRVSTLFSPDTPTLILNFLPRVRINDSLGLIGSLGIAAQDSTGMGFSGSLSGSYFF